MKDMYWAVDSELPETTKILEFIFSPGVTTLSFLELIINKYTKILTA